MAEKPDERAHSVGVLDRIRATPGGRHALKIAVGIAGALIIAVGALLIPLPGPGWAIVFVGLAIWAVEFPWARRVLNFARRYVQAWTRWIGRQSWPVRGLVGLACLIFVSAIVWESVRFTFGVDLIRMARDWLAAP
ncbi:TIGR02611 family protein [Actinoplanes sp. NPDC049265]|uniref:TIGR02611 family protein n=1 Tax=Actinoplanes sp. NPDC049265 TaxID=3363902 RepID=UPI00371C88CA